MRAERAGGADGAGGGGDATIVRFFLGFAFPAGLLMGGEVVIMACGWEGQFSGGAFVGPWLRGELWTESQGGDHGSGAIVCPYQANRDLLSLFFCFSPVSLVHSPTRRLRRQRQQRCFLLLAAVCLW